MLGEKIRDIDQYSMWGSGTWGGTGWRSDSTRWWLYYPLGGLSLVAAVAWLATGRSAVVSAVYLCLGLVVLGATVPPRRATGEPVRTFEDGEAVLALPRRPLPLRIALARLVGGLLPLGIAIFLGAAFLIGGHVVEGLIVLLLGGGLAATLALRGAVNLLPSARRPLPWLIGVRGVGWQRFGRREWTEWHRIGSIEASWAASTGRAGAGDVGTNNITAPVNYISLRGPGREIVGYGLKDRFAVDPEVALAELQKALAEHRPAAVATEDDGSSPLHGNWQERMVADPEGTLAEIAKALDQQPPAATAGDGRSPGDAWAAYETPTQESPDE